MSDDWTIAREAARYERASIQQQASRQFEGATKGLGAQISEKAAAPAPVEPPTETIDDVRAHLAKSEEVTKRLQAEIAQAQQTIAAFQVTIRVQAKVLAE